MEQKKKIHSDKIRTNPAHKKKKPTKKSFNYMKKKYVQHGFSYISMMIMLPVFFLTAGFLLFVPRSEKSNMEKRNLATFPSFSFEDYFSGKFTAGVTEFYDDTVPDRDNFKKMGYDFKSIFGIHTDEEVKIIGNPVAVVNDKDKKDDKKQQSSDKEKSSSNTDNQSGTNDKSDNKESNNTYNKNNTTDKNENKNQPDEYKEASNGIIVVKHNGHYRGLELFGGGSGNDYVDALNNYRKDLDDSVNIYSMIVPKASQFYLPEAYSGYSVDQRETISDITSRLSDGITFVDALSALEKHKEEDIYLRTDHHWSPLGAYYAAQEFAKTAGVDFKDLSTYKKEDIENFSGTLIVWSKDSNLSNDTETFSYYVPANNDDCTTYYYDTSFNDNGSGNFFNMVGDPEYNAYLTFMGGDEQVVKVKTNVNNGRKLLIVKDSYGNALPGYLFSSFEEIYVVDMRYFNLNLVDFAKKQDITDMLFSMVSFSAIDSGDKLEKLRTQ